MDTFARALIIADNVLSKSDYKKVRKNRMHHLTKHKEKNLKKENYHWKISEHMQLRMASH
jgi:hypothetical protein